MTDLCRDCIHAMIRRTVKVMPPSTGQMSGNYVEVDAMLRFPTDGSAYYCGKTGGWIVGGVDWCGYRQTEEKKQGGSGYNAPIVRHLDGVDHITCIKCGHTHIVRRE